MTAYYNENDPKAAAWLRELMKADLIVAGDVDERSIEDVTPMDVAGYDQCHFFTGIGGWSYALRLAGWEDTRRVWTGSCPCQPFSAAGKGGGFSDERHLWPSWFYLIVECRPAILFGEQVASKAGLKWFDLVSTDLEAAGYASGAGDLCAAGVGAPHIRQRLYFVAHFNDSRLSDNERRQRSTWQNRRTITPAETSVRGAQSWLSEPDVDRVVDGFPGSVDIVRGYGNAIVPQVAQAFIESYMSIIQ